MSALLRFSITLRRPLRAAASMSALLWITASAGIAVEPPVVHTVLIEGTSFTPQTLTVHRGDTIVWTNKDPFPHTVTARNGQFDSHLVPEDHSWKYTARKRGEFPYFCALHQTMTGVLIVK
jgi:plastocyanin